MQIERISTSTRTTLPTRKNGVLMNEETTFYLEPKEELPFPLAIEIGDSKQPDFYPQAKLAREGNARNLSVRLVHSENAPSVNVDGDVVEWKGQKQEVAFYSVPDSKETPSGAIEVDVTLFERPAKDQLQFTLRTKGIKFYYQPELTPEEVKEGDSRPDNVVGSWAVWASDLTNKFGHIYNSLMVDAAGNSTRTNPQIVDNGDGTGTLTINFDKKFLDNAVYPIRHAAGLTLGTTSSGASGASTAPNGAYFRKVTAAATGTVSDFNMLMGGGGSSSEHYKGVIWDYSGLTVITNSVSPAIDATGLFNSTKTATYSPQPSVTNGTNYYLGFVADYTGSAITYDTGSAGDGGRHTANSYSSPTTIGTISNNNRLFACWANYGGAGPSNLKTDMGLAAASIKTIDGVAIASVKTVDGLN